MRAAQVPHVHLLGDIRPGVVHDRADGHGSALDAQAFVAVQRAQGTVQPGRRDTHIDEPGTGDRDLLRHACEIEAFHHRLRDRARVGLLPGFLRHSPHQAHRGIGLVVAEVVVEGHGDLWFHIKVKCGADRLPDSRLKLLEYCFHGFAQLDRRVDAAFNSKSAILLSWL